MKQNEHRMKIEKLRADLKAAEADAEPNYNATDIEREAARVNAARTRAEIFAGRLSQAERDAREDRRAELHAARCTATEKRDALLAQAAAADLKAERDAVALFVSDFQGRIESVIHGMLSVAGRELRLQAAAFNNVIDECTTELEQLSR